MYTIGCDPELFLYNTFNKKYYSAHNMVKGDKISPYPVKDGATQVDGVAAEFNISPCTTVEEFLEKISSVKRQLQDQIYEHVNAEYILQATPVATFDPHYFRFLPEEVKVLGCEPDYNAYTKELNDFPATKEPFRTGSGHIHVGNYTPKEKISFEEDVLNRVKQLDATVFLSSLLWDSDTKRRTLYGAPGAFRYKWYGFEYRVLSNAWVRDVMLQQWVFEATVRAMELYDNDFILIDEQLPTKYHSRESLIELHKRLHNTLDFPLLPKRYLHEQAV